MKTLATVWSCALVVLFLCLSLDLTRSVWIEHTEVGGDVGRDKMIRMEHMVGVERKAGKRVWDGLIQSLYGHIHSHWNMDMYNMYMLFVVIVASI